jgi:uncharacterized protein (DUF885 family)
MPVPTRCIDSVAAWPVSAHTDAPAMNNDFHIFFFLFELLDLMAVSCLSYSNIKCYREHSENDGRHGDAPAKDVRDDLATLDRFDRSAENREGRLSYDALHYFLQIRVDGQPYLLHDFPVDQNSGIQSALPEFMQHMHAVNDTAEAEQ